jgi:hypothetical protein
VSELVARLEAHPEASIAFGGQEVIDEAGAVLKVSADCLPEILSGPDFILATWHHYRYGFKSVSTFLARTERMRAVGGYPCFTRGTHPDDAMVVMLCLDNHVALSSRCVWRNRLYEASHGMSIPIRDLAAATKEFFHFLKTDPILRSFAAARPAEWGRLRACLVRMAWSTYFSRWRDLYRKRMAFHRWVAAAFYLPLISG